MHGFYERARDRDDEQILRSETATMRVALLELLALAKHYKDMPEMQRETLILAGTVENKVNLALGYAKKEG